MTKTFEISYEELEEAIVPFMIQSGYINDEEDVEYYLDMNIPLNENGMIEFDITELRTDEMSEEDFIKHDRQLTEEMRLQNIVNFPNQNTAA